MEKHLSNADPKRLSSHHFEVFQPMFCFCKQQDSSRNFSRHLKVLFSNKYICSSYNHNLLHGRLFSQILNDFSPIPTPIHNYGVIPRKPELSTGTANYFINVLTIGTKPSFTYFYFRSTNPTNSRQLILKQQVICLIIKTPLANGKVCTSVFYLKTTQIINLLIRTNKGMKNALHGFNSPNFLKRQFSRRTLWHTQRSKYILNQAVISFLH